MQGPLDPTIPDFADDLRAEYSKPQDQRQVDDINHLIIHRVGGPEWPDTIEALLASDRLLEAWAKVTGGDRCSPYPFLCEPSGRIAAVHHITRVGKHAGAWNKNGLALGVIGDFRLHDPTSEAWEACLRWAKWGCDLLALPSTAVKGHTELPNSTKHPRKQCPGRRFNMNAFRRDLR